MLDKVLMCYCRHADQLTTEQILKAAELMKDDYRYELVKHHARCCRRSKNILAATGFLRMLILKKDDWGYPIPDPEHCYH